MGAHRRKGSFAEILYHRSRAGQASGCAGSMRQIEGACMGSASSAIPRIVLSGLLIAVISPLAARAQATAPPAVLVQPAALRVLSAQSEFIGRVQALEKVDLRARVEGFLGPRRFKDGDPVKQDQVLFQIERDPFEAAVEQRKAQVASAGATLTNQRQRLKR